MEEKNLKMANCSTSGSSDGSSRVSQSRETVSVSGERYGTVWECVIPYVQEARDRDAVSLVCKWWYEIDAITRKHVTMALCYTATPQLLSRRFPQLESLKLKGKPRAAMFDLITEDWGGYVTPWVEEVIRSLGSIRALHFRRMIVTDADLELLATSATGNALEVLKLDKCSGYSTDGLLHIGRLCRNIKTLYMEDSRITENDGEWLHQLALNNTVLEDLNFYMTDLSKIRSGDIELIAKRCPSLASVKISDSDISDLIGFFRAATSLEEFGGGIFNDPHPQAGEAVFDDEQMRRYSVVFPPKLHRLGLSYLGKVEMPIVYPIASKLQKLDLLYTLLDTESHCQLLQRCPNLEVLEARNVIGDRGLGVLAQFCKKMRRLRIERGEDEQEIEDEEGMVTQTGIIALAQGCLQLEYLAVYVYDITNAALECIGTHSKNLCDFRLVLLEREDVIADLPLDNGVRALLVGCHNLVRFALYLRQGALTDVGLGYVGQYSPKVRWMLLGCVGDSDEGLLKFAEGCPSLQKLEMRGCRFSERALAQAALQLDSLRYLWVQGYLSSGHGRDLDGMVRPYWNIELIPARRRVDHDPEIQRLVLVDEPAHILAYYSLAGQRTDFPDSVMPYPGNRP